MRIVALYDADGRILAATTVEDSEKGPVPVASEDTEVDTFDVPEPGSQLRLDEVCTGFRVDRSAKQLYDTRSESS